MVNLGSDAGFEEARWLEMLPDHAIFSPLQSNAPSRQCIAIRNTDLIVANGKSLRITSLSEIKHGRSNSSNSSISNQAASSISSYKDLISEVLDFDISEVILNPTGKLLAVIGSQRIAVVVLPRPGIYSSKTVGRQVAVKAALIGTFYYHERIGGRARIACVKWHPWGQLGSSLLVMSKDGLLREFDVSSDVQEPIQSVSLLPSTSHSQSLSRSGSYRRSLSRSKSRSQTPSMHRSVRSSSRFALDDDDDDDNSDGTYIEETSRRYLGTGPAAVSFTMGIDQRKSENDNIDIETASLSSSATNWNTFTIFTICTNGDVYALCPFMPKTAIMSLSLLRRLPSLVTSETTSDVDNDLRARFISSLLRQVKHKHDEGISSESPKSSRRSVSATPMSIDPRGSVPPEGDESRDEIIDQSFVIQAPSITVIPQAALPQGPFLLYPAPIELSEDRENVSTDIFYSKSVSGEAHLDILGFLGDDGRVDLCLLLESIEPRWTISTSKSSFKSQRRVASSGRYALSDSDSEEEDHSLLKNDPEELPRLFVYETIDLNISESILVAHPSSMPQFILDPLYADTVYIKHSKGAHVVCFGRWSRALLEAMNLSESERGRSMERTLHQTITSDVVQVIETSNTASSDVSDEVIGICIVSDIYLSYSFIALTYSGAVVGLELGLRVEDEISLQDYQQQPQNTSGIMAEQMMYTSLLGDGPPFTPPEPFKMLNGLPYHPRTAIKGRQSREELKINTESLRNLGNIVSTLRGEMRKIVQGGNAVQSRLDLQSNELHRQLKKLTEMRNRLNEDERREEMLEKRIANVVTAQQGLRKRSDWLLQKLVENHSPEISIYEAKWLKELERLEEEVGKKGEDQNGLLGRVAKLEYQLEVLRPSLIKSKEKKIKDSTTTQMGSSQLQAIETLLAKEAQLLTINRNIITDLQSKVQRQTTIY